MNIVTTRQLTKRLQIKDVASSYLLLGEDIFIQDFNISVIKTTFLSEGGSHIRISIGDDPEAVFMDELNSISLFENKRLIQVRQISKLSAKAKVEFIEYLKKPSLDICLILINENYYDKTKFSATLKNASVVIDVRSPINENLFLERIVEICQAENIKIDIEAIKLIIERKGNSIMQVYGEVMNLWMMGEEKKLIDVALVEGVVGYEREYPLWKYLHTMGNKNLPASLEMIDSLIDYGISIPQITASLNTLFENVYWAKFNKKYPIGYPQLNKFLQNNLQAYCRQFALEEINKIIVKIRNADITSKTKTISPHNILIPLTITICQGNYA